MYTLAPSILSGDFAYLGEDLKTIKSAGCRWVHVDVMDGNFVPNITIGIPTVAALRKYTDLVLDVHLMIDRPLRYVEAFCKAGADYVTVHVEADTTENNLLALDKIHALGAKAAVSLKPNTPASAVLPFLDKVDMILVMTVEPGFGGQRGIAARDRNQVHGKMSFPDFHHRWRWTAASTPRPARCAGRAVPTSLWPGLPSSRQRTKPPL